MHEDKVFVLFHRARKTLGAQWQFNGICRTDEEETQDLVRSLNTDESGAFEYGYRKYVPAEDGEWTPETEAPDDHEA